MLILYLPPFHTSWIQGIFHRYCLCLSAHQCRSKLEYVHCILKTANYILSTKWNKYHGFFKKEYKKKVNLSFVPQTMNDKQVKHKYICVTQEILEKWIEKRNFSKCWKIWPVPPKPLTNSHILNKKYMGKSTNYIMTENKSLNYLKPVFSRGNIHTGNVYDVVKLWVVMVL